MEVTSMSALGKGLHDRHRSIGRWVVLAALAAGLVFVFAASTASLPGSNFEIDEDANLRVDGPDPPSLDWMNVAENRKQDLPSGQNDDSYTGGAKEDDACPATEFGSIPNNKSDLQFFGGYFEPEANGPGFLNIFWQRVNNPSGTTLMDFELNQSSTDCGNGVNPVRTEGDLLIEYRIEQGGARATLKVREWTGSAWGPATDITGALAIGDINDSPIPAAESDGLITSGILSPRTFGEASLDLDFIFDEGSCESFGSAFLKSRASDAFNSALKDFIKPVPVNISNCGRVIIRKQTLPDEDPNSTQFGYTKSFPTDPATPNTFTLTDDGVQTYAGVLFGSGYTVVEDVIPAGWEFDDLDCSASTNVTPQVNGATVTFAIDSAADILDCTYTNRAQGAIIVKKITDDGQGAFDFTSDTLDPDAFTLTTTGPGEDGSDSRTFGGIAPGTYDVAETVPAGWNLVSATCSDGSPVSAIVVSPNETVTCTFHNARERGTIIVEKITDDGQGSFDYTSSTLDPAAFTLTTTGPGEAGKDSRTFAGILAGTYDVAETVPAGWNLVSATCSDGSPVSAIALSDGETVTCTFHNARERGGIDILKLRKHAADGPGDHPHAGVIFTVEGGELPIGGVEVMTDANGEACVDNLVVSSLVGDYTVTETLPGGYHNVGPLTQTKSVTEEATCSSGNRPLAEFHNMPLTNVTVSVDSQIDGGTASRIDCDGTIVDTDPDGDGTLTLPNLEPRTVTCTIMIDP
jgi:Prealbumin-like fold domain